jgi:hypothetical protein
LKSSRWVSFPFLIAYVILAALVFRLIFFGISLEALPASADEANGVLAAKNISRGEFPLLITGSPYQFPIESYFLTPLVSFLPRNSFGARYAAVLTGLLALAGFLMIYRSQFSLRRSWPGFLLLLFPSAYWLLWQAAYIPTNYNPALMLCVFGLLSALLARLKKPYRLRLLFLAGVLLGLAFCGIMMLLPFLLMTGLFIIFNKKGEEKFKGLLLFFLGLSLGLLPYFLAGWLIPGANQAVSGSYPWPEALRRSWSLLRHNLPVAMGLSPCLYPDFKTTLSLIPGLGLPFTIFCLLILGMVTILAGFQHLKKLREKKGLCLSGTDIFLGVTWACLLLFILSRRSHTHTYRYLLPLVWSFPFLVGYLYMSSPRRFRTALGAGIFLLILLNITTGWALMRVWLQPGFASAQADMPALQPALHCLETMGINRAYASMWMASRIAYETDEKILCTQPYNTRFDGWPMMYQEEVDASGKVAYVLTNSDRFRAGRFEEDLRVMGVTARKAACGEFAVYTDFNNTRPSPGILIPSDQLKIKTSHNNESARILSDGLKNQRWGSRLSQEKGMWIDVKLPTHKKITGVVLWYNQYAHDRAPSLNLLAGIDNQWRPVVSDVPGNLDRFSFRNGHPTYREKKQTITFPAVTTDGLRLEIAQPDPKQDWSLTEIGIYQEGD